MGKFNWAPVASFRRNSSVWIHLFLYSLSAIYSALVMSFYVYLLWGKPLSQHIMGTCLHSESCRIPAWRTVSLVPVNHVWDISHLQIGCESVRIISSAVIVKNINVIQIFYLQLKGRLSKCPPPPRYLWPFFLSQRASNAENVSIWWQQRLTVANGAFCPFLSQYNIDFNTIINNCGNIYTRTVTRNIP